MGVCVSFLEYVTSLFACLTLSLKWPADWLCLQLIYNKRPGKHRNNKDGWKCNNPAFEPSSHPQA